MGLDVLRDQGLALWYCPFVHSMFGIVDIAVKKFAIVTIEHDLPNRRARAFGHHTIDDTLTFRHPGSWKSHISCSLRAFWWALVFEPLSVGASRSKNDKIAILHAYPMPPKPTRMTRIAFILLCHKDPDAVRLALRLTAEGDFTAIHFDRRASNDAYASIEAKLSSNPNVLGAASGAVWMGE